MPFLSPNMLLEEIAKKLETYCGLSSYLISFIPSEYGSFKRSMIENVSQCIDDIRTHKRIKTLPELALRLSELEEDMPEDDRLRFHLDQIEDYVYNQLLNSLYFFYYYPVNTDGKLDQNPDNRKKILQFWQMMDLISANVRKQNVITSLWHRGFLHLLFLDKPLYTMSSLFAAHGVKALHGLIGAIHNKAQIRLLLDQLRDLPQDANRADWMLAQSFNKLGFRECLISQTLQYAPERFDEVFGNLELLSPKDKTKVLIPYDRFDTYRINLLERAAHLRSDALNKILLAISTLPATKKIDSFLQETISGLCWGDSIDSEKAQFLLDAIFAIPDQSLLIQVLGMQEDGYSEENSLFTRAIRSSELLFVRILHFVSMIETIDIRNHYMIQIIEEAKDYPVQSMALIQFVLQNPSVQNIWLTDIIDSNWNLLHIAAQDMDLSESLSQLLECIVSKQEKEKLLAQRNHLGYTPLMLAVEHSPDAVAPLVAAILECKSARSILKSTTARAGDSALDLANYSQVQSSIKLIRDALQSTKSLIPALADSLSNLFAASSHETRDLEQAESEITIVYQ